MWRWTRGRLCTASAKQAPSCCPPSSPKPVVGDYKRTGEYIYHIGQGNKGVIFVHDIFGHHPNAFLVCDMLAARGFNVLMPDFFGYGNEWPMHDYPHYKSPRWPKFYEKLSYDKHKEKIVDGIGILKLKGATTFGAVGMCWGGKMVLRANCDGLVRSAASCHPSFLTPQDAIELKGPVCLLPSKDEPDMTEIEKELARHPFAQQNIMQRFHDMHHGWCAGRGDMSNEINKQRVHEAVDIMSRFLHATL